MTESRPTPNPLHELVSGAPVGGSVAVPPPLASVPDGCLLDTLGITLTHVGRGRSRAEMVIGSVHLNQRGVPQGGAIVTLADAAAGWASYAALAEGRFTTLDLTCHLVGRAEVGTTLVAVTSPVHLGRQTLVLDVEVLRSDVEDAAPPRRLVARFSCTQLILAR